MNEPTDDKTPDWYTVAGSLGLLLAPIATLVVLVLDWFPGAWFLRLEVACAGFSSRISFLLTFMFFGALVITSLELVRAIGEVGAAKGNDEPAVPEPARPAVRAARVRKVVSGLALLGASKILIAVCIFAPELLSYTFVFGWLLLFLIPLGPSFGLLMVIEGLLSPRVSLGRLNANPVEKTTSRERRFIVVGKRRAPVADGLALPPVGTRVLLVQLRLYGRVIAVVPD